ncbi:MAG: 6-hydroxymethylpterin diphosphokinase MptE-like protein, partial [Parachlamydiales bacterium]
MVAGAFEKNLALLVEKNRFFSFFASALREAKESFFLSGFPFALERKCPDKLKQKKVLFLFGLRRLAQYPFLLCWLKAKKKPQLICFETELADLGAFLKEPRSALFLKQNNFEIHFLASKAEGDLSCRRALIDSLARRFFSEPLEFLGSREPFFLALRSDLEEALVYHAAYFYDYLAFSGLLENLWHNFQKLPAFFEIGRWRGAFRGCPALVVGAGPSLEREKGHLKKLKKRALVIAGGSALPVLDGFGLKPHLGVAIDPNERESRRLEKVADKQFPLLFLPRLHKEVLKTFPGPFGYLKSHSGPLVGWLEQKAGLRGRNIDQTLGRGAFSVALLSLALAHFLGCNPIILCGLDLAYSGKRRYAGEGGFATGLDQRDLGDRLFFEKDKRGRKVTTLMRFILERQALLDFACKQKKTRLIDASCLGLKLNPLESASLKDLLKTTLKRNFAFEAKIKKLVLPSRVDSGKAKLKLGAAWRKLYCSLKKTEKLIDGILAEIRSGRTGGPLLKVLFWD